MIDLNKEYKTRGGKSVRVLCVDSDVSGYPVVAIIDSFFVEEYTVDGLVLSDGTFTENDLIEVKPKIERVVWINVYKNGTTVYFNKKGADRYSTDLRLACLPIRIDCEVGEGLDQ